jgi:hypothetical protein
MRGSCRIQRKGPIYETGKGLTPWVVGLANHSVLVSKDGKEFSIDDSAATSES